MNPAVRLEAVAKVDMLAKRHSAVYDQIGGVARGRHEKAGKARRGCVRSRANRRLDVIFLGVLFGLSDYGVLVDDSLDHLSLDELFNDPHGALNFLRLGFDDDFFNDAGLGGEIGFKPHDALHGSHGKREQPYGDRRED